MVLEEDGTGLVDLGQILTPIAGPIGLKEANWIDVHKIIGTDPSSPIGMAGA